MDGDGDLGVCRRAVEHDVELFLLHLSFGKVLHLARLAVFAVVQGIGVLPGNGIDDEVAVLAFRGYETVGGAALDLLSGSEPKLILFFDAEDAVGRRSGVAFAVPLGMELAFEDQAFRDIRRLRQIPAVLDHRAVELTLVGVDDEARSAVPSTLAAVGLMDVDGELLLLLGNLAVGVDHHDLRAVGQRLAVLELIEGFVELRALVVQRILVMRDDRTVRRGLVGEDDGAVFGLEFRDGLPILADQHETELAVRIVHVGRAGEGPREDHAGDAAVASIGIDEGVLLHVALKAGNRIRKGRGVVGALDGDGDVLLDDLAAFDLHLHLEGFGLDVAIVHGLDDLRAVFGQRIAVGTIGIDLEFSERMVKKISLFVRGETGLAFIGPRLCALVLGIDDVIELQRSGDGRIRAVWQCDGAVFEDLPVAGTDGRYVIRSGDVDDQLAGAVGTERVGDTDVEGFLSNIAFGQRLEQARLGDLVGVAAILIELEDAVLAFDDLHQLAAALDAVAEVARRVAVALVGVVGAQVSRKGVAAVFLQHAFTGLVGSDLREGLPVRVGDDFGDDVPVFVGEDGPVIGALHVDIHVLRGDEVRVAGIDVERAVRVGAAVHEGFVGGIVDADLEVVEQLFTLSRVEGVEVRGFLRARFRQDEGVDDLGHAVLGDDFGVQGPVVGVQVARVELAAHDEPGDQMPRALSCVDLLDLERAELVSAAVEEAVHELTVDVDGAVHIRIGVGHDARLGDFGHDRVGQLAHEDRGVSAARHVDGDVLLRPRALFVAHEDGEFIRVLFAVDQVFVRRVGILAGGRVDGEHAVLGFDPGMSVAHALVAVKGRLQVIDVGTVRVADMASGDAVGQPGTEVHVRSLGIGREGLVIFGHGDCGVGRRVSVGRRTRGNNEAVIIAAEQFQFGPIVGALDGDAE